MHAYVQPHVLASLCRPARARGQAATPLNLGRPAGNVLTFSSILHPRGESNDSRVLLAASHVADEFLTFSFVAACACALELWVKNLKKRM
jgi:hypothetical protein